MDNTSNDGDSAVYEEVSVPTDPAAYTDRDERPGPPKMLSPSRMEDFGHCPRQFFYKSILRLPTTPSPVAAKGTVAHAVLEWLFKDVERDDRSVEAAVGHVDAAFAECLADDYHGETMATLFDSEPDPDEARAAFLADVTRFVENYFTIENPRCFDAEGTEMWVRGWLDGFGYVGVIDRLDRISMPDGTQQLYVSDYKTGKMPKLEWASDKFNAMRIYAVLLREMLNEVPTKLRLVYIGEPGRDRVLSLDINETTLDNTRARMKAVSKSVQRAHSQWQWPTKPSKLCNWCDFADICPAKGEGLANTPVLVRRKVKEAAQDPSPTTSEKVAS